MHVLIADDDASIRQILREVLEDEGYTVAEAANGLEALVLLRTQLLPCIALIDALMPHLDGATLVTLVAANRELAAPQRYVLMTAASESLFPPGAFEAITRLGIPIIGKPFDLAELLAVIAQEAQRVAVS